VHFALLEVRFRREKQAAHEAACFPVKPTRNGSCNNPSGFYLTVDYLTIWFIDEYRKPEILTHYYSLQSKSAA